ncbi:MAG: hypothetical protein AB1348_03180 [Nitrospirota bacterium]
MFKSLTAKLVLMGFIMFAIFATHMERKNEACGICHSAIRDNIPKIEVFVKSLEDHYE